MHTPSEDLTFRKSSYSDRSDCVEVADLPTGVDLPTGATGAAVRDTRNRNLGHLVFPSSEWSALLDTVRR